MTIDVNDSGKNNAMPPREPRDRMQHRPEWADGLRKLYDSVVDEPIPDSFRDLLDQLDKHA